MNYLKKNIGFTYIELMITLGILGLLASVALPFAQLDAQRQKESLLRDALHELRSAIDSYKLAADQGRIRLSLGDSGYPHSLSELVDGVVDQKSLSGTKIFFLRRIPLDPMVSSVRDDDFSWGVRSYSSPPDDPQKGNDVFDVYSKSEKIGLNGRPYNEW